MMPDAPRMLQQMRESAYRQTLRVTTDTLKIQYSDWSKLRCALCRNVNMPVWAPADV